MNIWCTFLFVTLSVLGAASLQDGATQTSARQDPSADIAPVPATSETTEGIVRSIISDYQGLGQLEERFHEVTYRQGGQSVFFAWFNPYSGRLACHLHGYRYSARDKTWTLFTSQVFEGTHDKDVVVEVSATQVEVRDARNLKVLFQLREEKKRMKGVHLYSWKHDGEWAFALTDGTNRLKPEEEVRAGKQTLLGLLPLEHALHRLAYGENVSWFGFERSEELRKSVRAAADAARLTFSEPGIQFR